MSACCRLCTVLSSTRIPISGDSAMSVRHSRIASATLLLLVLAACSNPPAVPPIGSLAGCQNIVDAIVAVRSFPELADGTTATDFLQWLADGTVEGFDVNEYFSVLSHLSMEPGYTLDYVYFMEFIGGEPILYGRPVDQAPYVTYPPFLEAEYPDGFPGLEELRRNFTEHIQVDGTPEGFFELMALRTMGSQFYQYWHAAYHDAEIVCNQARLEALIAEHDEAGIAFPPDVIRKARAITFEPVVAMGEDTATVKMVVFTDWGGFVELSTTISRGFPHEILLEEWLRLVEYDCGIQF